MKTNLRDFGARGAFFLLAGSVVAVLLGAGCASGASAVSSGTGAGESAVATATGGGPMQGRIYEEWFDQSSVVLPPPPAR